MEFRDCANRIYRHKMVNFAQVTVDWCGDVTGRKVLELGCGDGTVALGMALQHSPSRVVAVDTDNVHQNCLALARDNIGIIGLPDNLSLHQIEPGQDLSGFGLFDVAYSWSVFEHVEQRYLSRVLATVRDALKPESVFFLQISPLYYSAFGSHLQPWVPEPRAHLSMQNDTFRAIYYQAPDASEEAREGWAPNANDIDPRAERDGGWKTYETLNKITAPHLVRLAEGVGFEIIKDYRTLNEHPIPAQLSDIYNRDTLLTEQVVLLLRKPTTQD